MTRLLALGILGTLVVAIIIIVGALAVDTVCSAAAAILPEGQFKDMTEKIPWLYYVAIGIATAAPTILIEMVKDLT